MLFYTALRLNFSNASAPHEDNTFAASDRPGTWFCEAEISEVQGEMVSLAVSSEFWNVLLLGFLFIFCLVTNLIVTERSKPLLLKSNILLLATARIRVWTR